MKNKVLKLLIPVASMMLAAPAMADWPVAVADEFTIHQSYSSTKLDLLKNDIGSNLKVVDVNAWSENGAQITLRTNIGQTALIPYSLESRLQNHAHGDVSYLPREGFFGQDAFWYVVEDDQGRRNAIRSIVNVTPSTLELPKPFEDFVDVPKDTSVRIDALSNDLFTNEQSIVKTFRGNIADFNTTTAQGGTVEKVEVYPRDTISFGFVRFGGYTLENTLKYQFKYTPPAGFVGTDSFTYAIKDGTTQGGDEINQSVEWTKVTLNVSDDNAVTSPWPVAEPDEIDFSITIGTSLNSYTPTEINVLGNDTGEDLVLSLDSNYSQEGARLTVNPNYPNRPVITYDPGYSLEAQGTSFDDKVWYVIEDKYGRKTFSYIDITVSYI